MSERNGGPFAAAENGTPLEKSEVEAQLETLRVGLLNAQYDLRRAGFAVVVLLAGDDRPGTGDALHALHEWLDARYLDTHAMFVGPDESAEDRERPTMWRYWRRLPRHGRIAIFLGGWATRLIQRALEESWDEAQVGQAIEHLTRFERALADNGTVVVKFWFHLPKKVLAKRLEKAAKNPDEHWDLEDRDWEILERYDDGIALAERVVRLTDSPSAPWVVIDSRDDLSRNYTVAHCIHAALTRRLASSSVPAAAPTLLPSGALPGGKLVLDTVDLTKQLDKETCRKALDQLQARLNACSRALQERNIASVMVFEGWDAAGKGGAIRRLTRAMPVRNVRLVPVSAPTEEELAHHYLWRFWRDLPHDGRTVIFDRSWYGRVLVERVEGYASEAQWSRAYAEINDFERQIHEHGTPLMKFWLHIDPDEQLRRFEARAKTAYKKYKLTDDDFRNREKWPLYATAVHDMVTRTDTPEAPWHLVAANDKRWARVEVLRIATETLEARLAGEPKKRKNGRKR